MFKVNDIIYQANMEDVIQLLKLELYQRGINRFEQTKPNEYNIQVSCPFHKDGQEHKPSFGINVGNGKCHCFACGWNGNITTMISQLFSYNDNGKFGEKWLLKRFSSLEIENRICTFNYKRCAEKSREQKYITEEELDSYRYIHPYMYKRGLTDKIIEEFDIGYDKERQCITFPIKDLNGNVVFVATRSVNSKFFGLPQGLNKPIYCAERFTSGRYKEAYIVESFFNCLTLWKMKIPAMALIGTGNRTQYEILERLPVRSYVLALDPDNAGRKAAQRFKDNVKGKIIKHIEYTDNKKDINDLQKDFLKLSKKL